MASRFDWTITADTFECVEFETDLYLKVTREPNGEFDFNGYKYPTQATVRAAVEAYALSAIQRHGLDINHKATR